MPGPLLDGSPGFRDDARVEQATTKPKARRHPMCPYCSYNLTGNFDRAMRFVRCPECGEYLAANEVRWSHRRGDWTIAVGLRNAAVFLFIRGAIVVVILAASVILVELLGQVLARNTGAFAFGFWTILLVQVVFGIPTGKALSTGFEEAAGFSSLLLPLLSTAALVAAAVVVATFLPMIWPPMFAPLQLMLFIACAVAATVIIVDYLREMA